jgi:hypothetical protein
MKCNLNLIINQKNYNKNQIGIPFHISSIISVTIAAIDVGNA